MKSKIKCSIRRFWWPIMAMMVLLVGSRFNAQAFVHPSALHTQADFDRMKAKVQAGAHPWIDSYAILTNNWPAQSNAVNHVQSTLIRGGAGENYQFAYFDTAEAYQLALRWKITGDNNYANTAIGILNSWATVCTNLAGDPNIQLLEIYGYQFACAAEIMRSYPGWASSDVAKFQTWMLNLWYPMDHGFLSAHQGACSTHQWANWDLCSMASMMAIGILCDNTNIYNEAVTYFKQGIGNGNIEQAIYYMHPGYMGQGQEMGRDQGHAGLNVALIGVICQMAYNQGDDLFAYQNNRVLSMCEYFAKFNIGQDVPYLYFNNCDPVNQANLGGSSRGDNRPCWDLIYNHYVNLMGLAAPWSTLYAARVRPEGGGGDYGDGGGYDQLGFTTLTCSLDPIAVGAAPSGLTAILNGPQQVQLNWWGTAYATNYLVKRATTSGGPYTTIATITTNLLTYTDSNLTSGVTYYYTVSALTPSGASGDGNEAMVSVQPQLVAYYKFNETSGTTAADSSSNGWTATLNGATWMAGNSNNAVNLNGSSQYVTVPNGITTNLADFTIAAWVYLNGAQGYWARIFDFGAAQSAVWGSTYYNTPTRYMFLAPSAGVMTFAITLGTSGGEQRINGNTGVPVNGWHHVAITLAGNTGTMYLDGAQIGQNTITITPSQLGTTTANFIGKSQWPDPYLNGKVDDFRIYSGALSAAQVAALAASYPAQPAAPANVVATPVSANQINLTWLPVAGAANYYVKRSTVNGGPYTTVSGPLTTANFSDTGLTGGTTYYYIITAMNDGGAANSAQASATTGTSTVIGSPGSWSNLGNTIAKVFDGDLNSFYDAANASGDWAGLDLGNGVARVVTQIKYCPRPGFGGRMVGGQFQGANVADFSSGVVTLFTVTATPPDGVMTVQDVANTQPFRYLRYIGPANGWCNVAEVQFLGANGTPLLHLSFDNVSGSTVINDGDGGSAMNGILNGSATIATGGKFGNCLQISGANATAASCRIASSVVPLNIGTGNNWTVSMWVKSSTAGGCYAYQGDGAWQVGNTSFYLNQGSGTGGTHAGGVRNSQGWEAGTATVNNGQWHHVVFECSGTTKTAYVDGVVDSLNPNAWTSTGVGGQFWIGGAGYSGDGNANLNGYVDEVYVYNRALSQSDVQSLYNNNTTAAQTLPSPWVTTDVGAVGIAGSAGYANGVYTVAGSGADTWGNSDQFRYVYQIGGVNCSITAKVLTMTTNTSAAAKAGVMVRESLATNSAVYAMHMMALNGAENLWRTSTGGSMAGVSTSGLSAPYWVRIVRSGSTFTSYRSPDGTTWIPMSTNTITMANSVDMGLFVCGHNNSALCTATFTNVLASP